MAEVSQKGVFGVVMHQTLEAGRKRRTSFCVFVTQSEIKGDRLGKEALETTEDAIAPPYAPLQWSLPR